VATAAEKASSEDNQLEMKAREQFAAGKFDDAIDTFAKLYAKSLNPVYLRNIGRCFQKKREPQKAIDEFQDYLAKTKSGKYKINAEERAEIEGYIKEMEALRDQQARAATPAPPPPPVLTPLQAAPVPTTPPPPAAPPPEAAPGGPAATLTATASQPEESHPVYTRWWFWTIIGAVVAGGVVTAVALSSGTSKPNCTATAGCQ
jgi:tetratricopeptide (TPR) repeat protein